MPPSIPGLGAKVAAPTFTPPTIETPTASVELTDAAPAKTTAKTWETELKPVSTAYNVTFNYRRTLLPSTIYRTAYDRDNDHLPRRVTREDYVKLLFETAATNDMNGVRALLDRGTDMNATNPRGETPLAVARRFGAVDTAALLLARGAH